LVRGPNEGAPATGGAVRLEVGAEPLTEIGERLAREIGYTVALISLDDTRPSATLADGLCEARLHDAWPVVDATVDPIRWLSALDDRPAVILVRGELPASLTALPQL
jgi:hypothetical protein